MTTFITVVVLYILGVTSVREFALPLMVGIVCGAYSSVCITGALWFVMKKKQEKAGAKEGVNGLREIENSYSSHAPFAKSHL